MASRPQSGRFTEAFITLLMVCAAASYALADDSHYQDFIIGGRAAGLGGAFGSIGSDPSGLFFNPAGIADVRQTNFQVSTNLYGFEQGALDDEDVALPVPGVESLDVRFTELIIIPASAGYVKTLDSKGPDGNPTQAYALSVVVPSFRSYQVTNQGEPDGRDAGNSIVAQDAPVYSRRVSDRSLWSGVGYAQRIGPLRLGVSAFYVLRTAVDTEKVATSARIGAVNTESSAEGRLFRTATNDVTFLNGNLLLLVGGIYQLTPQIRLGVAVQTPSLRLHSYSALQSSVGESIPDCSRLGLSESDQNQCFAELGGSAAENPSRSVFQTEDTEGESETKHAPAVRLSASYMRRYKFTASVDLVYHFPVEYELVKTRRATGPSGTSVPEGDSAVLDRLPFNPKVERRGVLNVCGGVEFLVVREVSVSAGFFTNFSSAPPIPERPSQDQQPHVDMRGITFGLGYFGKHSLSRIGVMYNWGDGRDVIPTNPYQWALDRSGVSLQRVDYYQSFFYVFVSSTFRY